MALQVGYLRMEDAERLQVRGVKGQLSNFNRQQGLLPR